MPKAGRPGALPSRGADAAPLTDQRLAAALAEGLAPSRIIISVTPEAAPAKDSRREAVRSSAGASFHTSIITAPRDEHAAASAPALSTSVGVFTRTRISRAASSPNSARPGA